MMSLAENETCVVVVLYNPTKENIKNVESLATHVTVIAVDNSNNASDVEVACYLPLYENKGIATAQNIGIKYAKGKGFNFILLLDQDSQINEDFVVDIYNSFIRIKKNDEFVGFVGPIFIDRVSGEEYKNYSNKDKPYTQTSAIISSGSLLSMEAIDKVGMMDESLFIDLVDFEWCWRAISLGYTGYMTREVEMFHTIGNSYHNWHGFVLGISAPFRYYYQYRNTLWLCKRRYVPLNWKIKSVLRGLLDMLLVPIFSKDGKKCLVNIIKGIKSGLFVKK